VFEVSDTGLRTPGPQAYAGIGGGLLSNASPNRSRGDASATRVSRGTGSGTVPRPALLAFSNAYVS
jgi:hypothetical protein